MHILYLALVGFIQIVNTVKISTSSFNVIHGPPNNVFSSHGNQYKHSYELFPTSRAQSFSRGGYSHGYSHSPALQAIISTFHSGFPRPMSPSGVTCGVAPLNCQKSMYRTLDGSCNNLQNPALGIANSRYSRLLSAKYGDGIHSPTTSISGRDLPNARLISLVAFGEQDIPDPEYTLINMQWGQIMTHDMSLTAGGTQTQKHAHNCCTDDGQLIPKASSHESCYPILVPHQDPVYIHTGTECMNFLRTTTDQDARCPGANSFKPAEQLTVVTHYMDLSLVYGNSEQQNRPLRALTGGRMIVDERDGYEWLPQSNNATGDCEVQNRNEICYMAGDSRVNQNPGLTILHTVLLREHNRIADNLAEINPHYSDERLFQEARKINIAQFQHISYYEWLPIFLGTENMLKNRLIYKASDNFINDYNPSIDPSVINSHATAAFRYFHTQIEGHLDLISELRSITGSLRLSDWFNRPGIIEAGDNYDSLIRGHTTQPEELTDINFDREIKEFLFRGNTQFGGDLRARDIQRNRDHGLASYNDFREFCGLRRAHGWEDFQDLISPESVENLKSLYESPEDVDLTVGASLESHVAGALAGPTFLCILTEQFYRTRVGDRFFYERSDKLTGFSRDQLIEIRKASMARLLCDNGNHVESIQPAAFLLISNRNTLVPCSEIPEVDLTKWRDYTQRNEYASYAFLGNSFKK